MNETLKNIQERFTCRAYTGAVPGDALLQSIAQAAIQSPSGMNRQAWQIIVVKNRALIAEMEAEGMQVLSAMSDKTLYERIQSRGGKLYYNAPCMVVVAINPTGQTGAVMDCGIVCQTIALAAQSLGLGSCICGLAGLAFSQGKAAYFKEKLKFPQGYEFGIAVLLGEAAAQTAPHEPDQGKITFLA